MEFDFLKQFPKRMKSVGAYALLFKNSINKGTWKQYGFDEFKEQTNLIFALLLYLMEQSLKGEPCTMDDIGSFLDQCNMRWFKKPMSYEDCKELGDFIINVVLCDEGHTMYFQGFDFEEGDYKDIHISFVANRIVYFEGDIRRTSYYLTEDGYNLLLSTLEMEGNLKLTIHEMIFKLHLEKASYDKAVEDIKNIFNLLRIQLQKITEAMARIRHNAISYSVQDYKELLEENLNTLSDTKSKFSGYRETVAARVKELEDKDINIQKLDKKDSESLLHLKTIEGYLSRTIEEHQKILITHFDLKTLYTKELENLSQMAFIKRFRLRSDLYDKILNNPLTLGKLDFFMRPLYNHNISQSYNLNKAFEEQNTSLHNSEEEEEIISFEEEQWLKEQSQRQARRHKQYKNSMGLLLAVVKEKGETSLIKLYESLTVEERETLVPNAEVFKEIMIELLKAKHIDIQAILQEQREQFTEQFTGFQLNECIIELVKEQEGLGGLTCLRVERAEGEPVILSGVLGEDGTVKRITCSNVHFIVDERVKK